MAGSSWTCTTCGASRSTSRRGRRGPRPARPRSSSRPPRARTASASASAAPARADPTRTGIVRPPPPMPFVPAEWHNKLVAMSFVCYAGGGDAAERAIAPLRKLATPIVDMVKPMPYAQIYPPEDDSYHPIGTGRNMLVDAIDKRSAESMIEHLSSSPATFSVAQLRMMRGAVARVPDDATAYAHRRRFAMINIGNLVQSVEELTAIKPWVDSFEKAIQ